VIEPNMAAKIHDEASSAVLEASAEYEAAIMSGDIAERALARERYDAASSDYSKTLAHLVKARRAHSRDFLSALADPTVACDPQSTVLASIAAHAAARPASAGLDVYRPTSHLYVAPYDGPADRRSYSYSDAGNGSAQRRFGGMPLTAAH